MRETQLPTPLAVWGGVECTINRVGEAFRDQIALSGHAGRPGDLDRFAALGLTALRYPLLWESFAAAKDASRLWAWHDSRLAKLRALGVRPIIGLLHHGSGPPGYDLLADGFAAGLTEHAARAAARYPWVRDWTPVNEPLTTARFAALYGHWYPHRCDEGAFWLALLNQVDAIRGAMRAIRTVVPDARLIQTEDLGQTVATPERQDQALFDNQRRWASWDILAGRWRQGHPLWERLCALGFGDRMQAMADAPCRPDLLGINHYLTSDRFLDHRLALHPTDAHGSCTGGSVADVAAVRILETAPGLEGALRSAWARYQIPMALTEIHNGCTREEQMRWFGEAWQTAGRLRDEGMAIEAVTAWSLLGAYDWDSLLTRADGRYESGVFDVRGASPRETALAPMLRCLAAGAQHDHPALDRAGWWRQHVRAPAAVAERPRPLLITGATGTLGQAFAGACRLRGLDHILTGRDVIDLCDRASIDRALDDARPWAVINCAGWVRVDEAEERAEDCFAANCRGSLALAEACCARDIHFTTFSSDLVFDGAADRPYVESDVAAPLSVYGVSKARADDALTAAAGRALVVRTASFFSPYDRNNFAVHTVDALRRGQPFRAAADCVTSPTYVPDLVRATLDLIIDGEIGLWHLANQGALSWAAFAAAIADALALDANLIDHLPSATMNWTAVRPRYAPLGSERGLILPSLSSAIDHFAATLA